MTTPEISTKPVIRKARPGDEPGIHEAHMRSIREVCVKDHGEDEVRGWGNRPLGNRWIEPIKEGHVWVIEYHNEIHGVGYIRIYAENGDQMGYIYALYITPDVIGQGLGQKLMNLMLDAARTEKVRAITLDSSLTAHDFYKKNGFKDSGPIKCTDIGGSSVRGYPMIMNL
jgi:putative acetyltransferase